MLVKLQDGRTGEMGHVLSRHLAESLVKPRAVKCALAVLSTLCPDGPATSRLLAGTPVAGMLLIHVSYVVRQPREQYTTDGDIHSTANVHADVSSSTQVRDEGLGPMPRRGNVLTMLTTHNKVPFYFMQATA